MKKRALLSVSDKTGIVEFAKELYDSGAFKKENIKETLMMLELMDFEGIGNLKASLRSEYGN